MATKPQYYGDINFDTDWGGDESTGGLPVNGGVINNFIRANLKNAFRAMYFDPNGNIMSFFKSVEDKDLYISNPTEYSHLVVFSAPLSFSGTIRQTKLINQLPSTSLSFTTNQTEANVSIEFICQEKSITDTEWTDTTYGGTARVFVDAGSTGNYIEIPSSEKHILPHEIYTFNVRDYLSPGNNNVKIQVISDDDEQTVGTIIYSAYLSEMYIEPLNLNWYKAFVQDDSGFTLGGFRIVGALAKTLHIKITKGTHTYGEFEKYVGTSSYITTPLYFLQTDVPEGESLFPDGGTGVYQVDAWLTAGTLESQHVIYPLMCVATEDKNTAQLVVMYNVAPTVYNYDTNHLFDLSVYNKGLSSGTPHVKVHATNEGSTAVTFKDEDITIPTDTLTSYSLNIEWITEATSELLLHVQATYADATEMNVIPIDNSGAYPATSGYLFYMNSANRTNSQANREKIINEADGSIITPEWAHMSWVNGIDGWTVDDNNRNCLRIPAGSKVSIPYRIMTSDNIAFDITFKVVNVADYNENIITIATNPTEEDFQGIRVKPTMITVHNSDDVGPSRDIQQGTNFSDEEEINLFVTIARNYNGNAGKNLVTGYINGTKNFQFEYGNVIWANNAPIIIGADKSDIFIYSIHAYGSALGTSNAETNYINSLASRLERIEAKNSIDSVLNGLHGVDYEKVKNNGYNYFVVEMLNGATVPQRANGWAKDAAGFSNFEMHFGQNPLWDFKLYNIETSGQGTTSMDYYRWNLRWRIDKTDNGQTAKKSVMRAYYALPTRDPQGNITYNELPATQSTSTLFDGKIDGVNPQHPEVMRITAKTNSASSMQSHKIGATRAYTALHDAVVGYNEAQQMAQEAGTPIPTVAVYEYPAFGFAKKLIPGSNSYSYEYIGLFTIGPDKGDKPTFGYDKVKNSLITIEGTDHAPRLATFRYPWNEDVQYRASNECLNIITGSGSDDLEKAWEVSNIHSLSTDKASDQGAIQEILETEFKPAYDVAYNNSTLIHGIALGTYGATASATLAYINAHKGEFNSTSLEGTTYKYSDLEFWIEGEYILYYEDKKTGLYTAGVNLCTQLDIDPATLSGKTIKAINEEFKAARRDLFIENAGNYWDIDDCLYCFAFLIIFGASDNFAKNSYPQKMATLANGGRWGWRQDDLDTLFDIDNQGKDTKPYWLEFKDDSNGTPYFNGSNSVFWNLLFECYPQRIRETGKAILDAMRSIGGGSNTFQGVLNFVKKMFWDNAQNYFPKSAYNEDASYKYEASWLDPVNGQVTVDPLAQSLGDHYRAEYQWVVRRTIYAMSLFHAGPFGIGGYTDSSLGLMSFRATIPELDLKTALAFYPAIHVGTNTLNNNERVMPDDQDQAEFVNPSGGEDTTVYIPATDWLRSLGDLKDLKVLGDNIKALAVNGKRLQVFKLGDDDPEEVTTNIETLSFTNTPSLEKIECQNVENLAGNVNLTGCTRLKEAYFDGTKTVSITLPNGSKIEKISYGDFLNFLQLRNLQFLTQENLQLPDSLAGITNLQVEGCQYIDAFETLKDIFETENNTLKYIRVVWSDIPLMSADSVDMLAQIADGAREGIYRGLTPEGQVDDNANPTIEGDLQMQSGIYMSSLDRLGVDPSETEDWPGGLKRAVAKIFGTMHIIYNPNLVFIEFEDPEVQRICVDNWGADGGLTLGQAAAVTGAFNPTRPTFKGNTLIESFDELQYFTGLTMIATGAFQGCSSLESVVIPEGVTSISANAFNGCALHDIVFPSTLVSMGAAAFLGCRFTSFIIPSGVSITGTGSLLQNCTSLEELTISEGVETINGGSLCRGCTSLKTVNIPSTLRTLNGGYGFYQCPIETINIASIEDWCRINFGTGYTENATSAPHFYATEANKLVNGEPVTRVVIPSDVTAIQPVAFYAFRQLKSITFHSGIISVGASAFAGVGRDVTDIVPIDLNLPNLTSLGINAFSNCSLIVSVSSLGNITSIGSGAFQQCKNLESVSFPSTLTTIGGTAFKNELVLQTIHCHSTVPPVPSTNAFQGVLNDGSLVVPAGAVQNYTSLPSNWGNVRNWNLVERYAEDGYVYIYIDVTDISAPTPFVNSGMVGNITKIELLESGSWVTIPTAATYQFAETGVHCLRFLLNTIGRTFGNGYTYEKVILPTGWSESDGYTWVNPAGGKRTIKEFVFPPEMTKSMLGTNVLVTNIHLFNAEQLFLPNFAGMAMRGDTPHNIFLNGKEITELTIPENVTSIPAYAFNRCEGLTKLHGFGSNITSIGEYAFKYCQQLECPNGVITIDDSHITSLGSEAFYNCPKLSFIINVTAAHIGWRNAFTGSSVANSPNIKKLIVTGDDTVSINRFWQGNMGRGDLCILDCPISYTGYKLGNLHFKHIVFKRTLSGSGGAFYNYNNRTMELLEFYGAISDTTLWGLDPSSSSNGLDIHFALDSIMISATGAGANKATIQHVYVGDGSSAAHDNAVLATYLADSDWATYASKLDTWYNYLQTHPDYHL